MRRWLPVLLLLPLIACGSSTVISPSPVPVPTPQPAPAPQPPAITITGTLTDTVSHAVIGSFSQTVPSLPAMVTVNAPGHLERQTRIGSSTPTVDLIPSTAPFSSIFYGQFARGTLENPILPLFVLAQAPSFYLQTAGLSAGNVDRLIAAAREIVPAMTGGRFTVTVFETGAEARTQRTGWIVVQLVNDPNGPCGRASLGAIFGQIFLNTNGCAYDGSDTIPPVIFQHEIGHALGFSHIDVAGSLMYQGPKNPSNTRLSDQERYHAAIAYHREAGNRDPDVDSPTSTPLRAGSRIVVVD